METTTTNDKEKNLIILIDKLTNQLNFSEKIKRIKKLIAEKKEKSSNKKIKYATIAFAGAAISAISFYNGQPTELNEILFLISTVIGLPVTSISLIIEILNERRANKNFLNEIEKIIME